MDPYRDDEVLYPPTRCLLDEHEWEHDGSAGDWCVTCQSLRKDVDPFYAARLSDYARKKVLPPVDEIAKPAHYQRGGLECVDVISAMTLDWNGPTAYRLGNTLKYLWRHLDKGDPKKDLQKAMEYLQMELDTYGNN